MKTKGLLFALKKHELCNLLSQCQGLSWFFPPPWKRWHLCVSSFLRLLLLIIGYCTSSNSFFFNHQLKFKNTFLTPFWWRGLHGATYWTCYLGGVWEGLSAEEFTIMCWINLLESGSEDFLKIVQEFGTLSCSKWTFTLLLSRSEKRILLVN